MYVTCCRYDAAVETKASHLRRLLLALDEHTVAIVVSDHGHIDRGGHGGINEKLRDIPLVVYRKGSGIGTSASGRISDLSDPYAATKVWDNTDLAPTICALLGIAVPGQALGTFIQPLLKAFVPNSNLTAHWNDL